MAKLHHVVFCVADDHREAAVAFWRDLGLQLVDIDLVEEGLKVLLDWDAGIEILSPSPVAGTETARFVEFLEKNGEGVYSVVVRTETMEGSIAAAVLHGAEVRYQQHRDNGNHFIDEADISPVAGMPITFLVTDRE